MLSQISIGRASVINVNNTSNKFVIINLPSSIYGIRLVLSSSVFSRLCRHDFSTLRENLEGLPVSLKFPKNSTKSFLSDVFGPKKKKNSMCLQASAHTHGFFCLSMFKLVFRAWHRKYQGVIQQKTKR